MLVKNIELKEGEPVTWVGVHAVRWRSEWGEPTEGFTELEGEERALHDAAPELLKVVQDVAALDTFHGRCDCKYCTAILNARVVEKAMAE